MESYCQHCDTTTDTLFNAFMVAFCAVCKRTKITPRRLQAFQCILCGGMFDEAYTGQSVCKSCTQDK